jgi:hypothetical protein
MAHYLRTSHIHVHAPTVTALYIYDHVRRLVDLLGRPGIVAKRAARNLRIQQQGYLRLVHYNRAYRDAHRRLVRQFYGPDQVTIKHCRKRVS